MVCYPLTIHVLPYFPCILKFPHGFDQITDKNLTGIAFLRYARVYFGNTVNTLVSGHTRELKKVCVCRTVRLRELFP